MLMNTFAALCAGFALNIIIGSPPGILNPENSVPSFLMKIERRLKDQYQESSEAHRMAGVVILIVAILLFAGIPTALMLLIYQASPVLALAIDCYLSWASFSMMRTKNELSALSRCLADGKTDKARVHLSKLTGLRCEDMNEDELIKRGVECAADCCADNVGGVLFYTALFGGAGGIFYRTVSLLRRSYSTRSSASDDFGTAAHKLWTVLDFVPAHIASVMAVLASSIYGLETEDCFDVYKRDRKNLQAAVLAPCRCVIASALGITLTRKTVFKDGNIQFLTIGDDIEISTPEDVRYAAEIMFAAGFFMLLLFGALKLTFVLLMI
ncbi:MAG: cobalamin biosynthesis protein [Ruminococcus sp.]|nr:cobalamin biosynthesis protein [Ruminococcus sp.]